MTGWLLAALPGFVLWTGLLLLPWRPWSTREALDAGAPDPEVDLSDVTALVPARNEAKTLAAELPMRGFWEKLLLPAFVYFFKLLYPFALSNNAQSRRVAAAAGGCVLVDTWALRLIGGFPAIRSALIDDCALARAFKECSFPTWIGLTHSAVSVRPDRGLAGIWNAVARYAFEQLRHSAMLLVLLTAVFQGGVWDTLISNPG